jgi:hypothetical protein
VTIPVLKIKVLPKPLVKGRMDVRFPAKVRTENFLTVDKANGIYTFDADYTLLNEDAISDPTTTIVAVFDKTSGIFKQTTLSALIASAAQIEQHITGEGPVNVLPNAGVVRVDQSVGAEITLNMPLASAKTCPVLISDWKGDAGTNNITVALSGSDTFPGGLTTWTIDGDTGSLFLRPIAGVGYAL